MNFTSYKQKRKNNPNKAKITAGCIHILSTSNNTIAAIADMQGNIIKWRSCGCNFKGRRKSSAYATHVIATAIAKEAISIGVKNVNICIRGTSLTKDVAPRAIANAGISILNVRYVLAIPHNGCRPPKKRRI